MNKISLDSFVLLLLCYKGEEFSTNALEYGEYYKIESHLVKNGFKMTELMQLIGSMDKTIITNEIFDKIKNRFSEMIILYELLVRIDKHEINIVTIYDGEYKQTLTEINMPFLFYKGSLNCLKPGISVIKNVDDFFDHDAYLKTLEKINEINVPFIALNDLKEDSKYISYLLKRGGTIVSLVSFDFIKVINDNSLLIEQYNLLFISQFPFSNTPNPIQIYESSIVLESLSLMQIVLNTKLNKGLAWLSAVNTIKNNVIPILIYAENNNFKLLEQGGVSFFQKHLYSELTFFEILSLCSSQQSFDASKTEQISVFDIIGSGHE